VDAKNSRKLACLFHYPLPHLCLASQYCLACYLLHYLQPLGGIAADRYNRQAILTITQFLSLVQSLALVFTAAYFKSVAAIFILSGLLGIINAFDVPARQSLLYDLTENKEYFSKTIAFNASMANAAKFIGPALAGIAFDRLGAAWCFGLNALSFIAVIIYILLMSLPARRVIKQGRQ
jgi:MFS family permease